MALAPQQSRFPGPSDVALVVAARAGEPWAFEALYRRYVDFVHGLAFRLLGGASEVDDVVQDTFIGAFRALDRLNDAAVFRSWLAGITVRTAHKLLRRFRLLNRLGLRRRDAAVEIDAFIGRACPPDVATELQGVYRILMTLTPDERIALVLRRVEGATLPEVAELTGMSLATVKRRLAVAEKRLAEATADIAPPTPVTHHSKYATEDDGKEGGEA